MLFNIFFLSSLLPLTYKLLQNANLNYLFWTLNLTHTILNASNPQLAKDCWICLSIIPLGDSAVPTSILDWTTGNKSLYHSYCGEPLLVSYLKYLHTSDQIRNSDILLKSLLTKLPSFNKKPPIGGPIAQKITLLQPAPFYIFRNSQNSSCDQPVDTIPKSMCNHTSTLLFATGRAIYNVSGPIGHSLTFTGRFPSTYCSTSPIIEATLSRVSQHPWMKDQSESEVTQSCPTLSDPVDCSLPGSSIHGILQARILEWVTIFFSRVSSWTRDRSRVSRIGGRHFNLWASLNERSKPPLNSSSPLTLAVVLRNLAYISCVGCLHISVYRLIGPEPAPLYTPVKTF